MFFLLIQLRIRIALNYFSLLTETKKSVVSFYLFKP